MEVSIRSRGNAENSCYSEFFYETNIVAIDLDRQYRTTANMFGFEEALAVTLSAQADWITHPRNNMWDTGRLDAELELVAPSYVCRKCPSNLKL